MVKLCMIVHQNYYTDLRVRSYAEGLASIGAQVDVLCLRAEQQGAHESNGVRVFASPIRRGAEKPWNYVFEYGVSFLLFTIRLLALFARNRYQIIHVHNMPDFLIFTALVPKLFGAKLILDIHDPMPEFYLSKYAEPYREGCLLRFLRGPQK